MRRLGRLAWWLAPLAACLALYWPGLRAWFEQDDFAWLALRGSLHSLRGLAAALLAPMAQGTLRPLGDRAFFLLGYELFGAWAAPYHAAVFATQLGAVALLAAVAKRVTGSKTAAFLAALFWVANTGLIVTLSWLSAYNQALCAFFLLAAFYCLLRHIQTGRRRWLLGEWAAFLLGLGALETMAVYPLIAAAWACCCARKYLRQTVPFFAAAAVYLLLHYLVQPYQSADPAYTLHIGPAMFTTLWTYWTMALGPAGLAQFFGGFPPPLARAATLLLTLGLLAFAIASARRRRWPAVFGLAWFLIALAPVLPLRDHVSSYYLTLPAIGLALAGAAAVAAAFSSGRWRLAAAAVFLAGIYLACGIVEGRLGSSAVRERTFRVRTLVLGAYRAHILHPDKALVFADVDEQLFWAGFFHRPFSLWGVPEAYLDPLSAAGIRVRPGLDPIDQFAVPGPLLRTALEAGQALVYEVEPRRLRSLTLSYRIRARELWKAGDPSRVDVGKVLYANQLGPTWYSLEDNRRWMPQFATVRLAGPRGLDERLYIEGWCPPEQLSRGPLRLDVVVAGLPLPAAVIIRREGPFQAALRLPGVLLNRPSLEVAIALDRTFRVPGDRRDLGLVFGSFEIRR